MSLGILLSKQVGNQSSMERGGLQLHPWMIQGFGDFTYGAL